MQKAEILHSIDQIADSKEQVRELISASWEMRRSFPKDSLDLALMARELSEKIKFEEGVAFSYRNSGTAYYLLSQYNQALIDLEKALDLFNANKNTTESATTLRNIGNVYHSMNLYEPAISCYESALAIARKENDALATGYNLGNIGHVYQKMKKFPDARQYMLEAKRILDDIQDTLGLADLFNNLGNVYLAVGEHDEGLKYLHSSLHKATSIQHLRGMAEANRSYGKFFLEEKDFPRAIKFLKEGLKHAEDMGELAVIVALLEELSVAYERAGDHKHALDFFREHVARKRELDQYDQQLMMQTMLMRSEIDRANTEKENYRKQNLQLEILRSELELNNQELERLSIVARQTENSILILSPDGTLEWVNSSFEQLNGMSLRDFKEKYGRTIYEVSNNPNIHKIISDCIAGKKTVRYEAPNYLENGQTVWESSTLTPIFSDDGSLFKLIIIDTDVTERKLAEELVRQKNKDITDSIHYARYLQEAILPSQEGITDVFAESFIYFRPKDIVSGDFFWYGSAKDVRLVAVADCTGHGVPGAFMSVVGNEMLNVAVKDPTVNSPAHTLDIVDRKVTEVFTNRRGESTAHDGMDIGLLVWHYTEGYLQYAGANRPLVVVRDGKAVKTSGDHFSIGGNYPGIKKTTFTEKIVQLEPGDMLYLFSDGYADQFGGKAGKKFMIRNFMRLLEKIAMLPVAEQRSELEKTFMHWKGEVEQVDDICVIGVRVTG
jgi:PAS domain S-box-containing protein